MRLYYSLFKIKLISAIQYKAAALSGIATQLFFGFVYILVYVAFYESNTINTYPMDLKALVNYIWLNQAFFSLTYIWIKDKDLLSMIKNGNVAYELCRPVNFYFKWYFTTYGQRIANVTLRFLPVLLITSILPEPYNMTLPPNIATFILFILSLLISSLLVTAIAMIFHLIVFFTLDEKGIMTILMVVGEIFSGGEIPLAFFPNFFKTIAYILPFRYICDLPFNIYSGTLNIKDSLINTFYGLIWLIMILILGLILSSKVLKKASIQGG